MREDGMKIGFCMLLWTTHVTEQHRAILEDLKATGYDGVEIPVFEGTPDYYAKLGRWLDEIGLDRTSVGIIPSLDKNPLSDDASARKAAVDYLAWSLECSEALGSHLLCGPIHSPLGHFTGAGPTDVEKARGRDFHVAIGDIARKRNIAVSVEAVNRFECYFVNTMDDLGAYLDTVAHPAIGALYDTFHANIEEKDPVAAFDSVRRHVNHIHITENDRGVPGRGHVPWPETYRAIKRSGYDGWLTIEAFGRALPALAAATRVWRDFSEGPEAVYRDGFRHIKEGWAKA
jgi:D-psicose/D-tagatose/L-ribulose 3-epimerase